MRPTPHVPPSEPRSAAASAGPSPGPASSAGASAGTGSTSAGAARVVSAAALAAALLAAPSAAQGQRVRGQVTGSDGGRPLEGVVVHLSDDEGEEVAGTFTDAGGRYRLEAGRPGRYRLSAGRIGYATHRGELFRLQLGGVVERDLRLEAEGVELSGIQVTGERSCAVDPEKARGTRRLWREARRALEAARWTADRGAVELRTRNFRHRLGEDLGVEETLEETRGYGFGRSPYTSLPAEKLVQQGYVDARGDHLDWYAPDAEVLLSDAFRRTHCFWVTREDAPEPGWVGLAFRPREDREVPEIEGVLWLDQGTAALERLTFSYVNVNLATFRHAAGGEVAFFRLPSGPWIVRRWTIRMPLLEKDRLRIATPDRTYHREEVEVAGYDEQGGQVIHVRSGDRVLYDFEQATVAGVVWDSLDARPLGGARVELGGTGRADTTGVQGRFRFPGVPEGSWQVVFRHPLLREPGLEGRAATVRTEPGKLARVRLSLPGAGRLAAELCPDRDEGTGVLLGRVVRGGGRGDADGGAPAAGARVAAVWPGGDGDPADRESLVHREVRADEAGRYRICGVPMGRELALRAEAEGSAGAVTRTRLASRPVERSQLSLGETGTAEELASMVRQQGFGPDVPGAGEDEGAPGGIVGEVRVSGQERPLSAARVRLDEDRVVSTDSAGRFRADGVAPGTHRVRVEYLGFGSQQALVRVPPGDTVRTTFLLQSDPVPLPELSVRVEGTEVTGKLAGFQRRRESGRGHYLTREEIERVPGNDLADALRDVPGLRVRPCPGGSGKCVVTTRSLQTRLRTITPDEARGTAGGDQPPGRRPRTASEPSLPDADSVPQGRRCGVAWFVDGAPVSMTMQDPNDPASATSVLDRFPKDHVEAIEVYSGPSQIPAQFKSSASGCAKVAVVIWTRVGG